MLETPNAHRPARVIPLSEVDHALSTQLIVAWAGESGEDKRLGWWRSDLVSEFGGRDLFQRLLPATADWAVLQGAREAARRRDAELRAQDHKPDQILSLFHFGFELDERLEERLQQLKRTGTPHAVLRELELTQQDWNLAAFTEWVAVHGETNSSVTTVGRRLTGKPPDSLTLLVRKLVAGLSPLPGSYPLPHFMRGA